MGKALPASGNSAMTNDVNYCRMSTPLTVHSDKRKKLRQGSGNKSLDPHAKG